MLLNKAAEYILALLTEDETIKAFPKEFIAESAKWVKSWFLKDDVKTEEKLKDPARSAETKKGIIESKLETLVEDPTFKASLEQQLAAFQKEKDRIKNVMVGGSIDAKQDVHVGDTEGGNDVGLTKKNVLENVTVKTDGSFHLGDGK